MAIVDEEGRIFGYVNVIDALVVLFVLAVGVAGFSLVVGGGASTDTTTTTPPEYVTLTIGPISEEASSSLASAENLSVPKHDVSLQVTDRYRTPAPARDAVISVVRAKIRGKSTPLPTDEAIKVNGDEFTYRANISSFGNASTLNRQQTTITVQTVVSNQFASAIQTGDTHTIGKRAVATITSVQRIPLEEGKNRLILGLELSTLDPDGAPQYAGRPVRIGTTIPFRTNRYSLDLGVISLNGAASEKREIAVQARATVSESVSETIESGDEFTLGGRTIARIDSVTIISLMDESKRRVQLDMTLQTARLNGQSQFLGRPVRIGTTIPFETDDYTLKSTVVGFGNRTIKHKDVAATLETTVPMSIAEAVDEGDEFSIGERTVAHIDSVTTISTQDKSKRRLRLKMTLRTARVNGNSQFLGRPVRIGTTIPFETDEYTFESTVVSFGNRSVERTPVAATVETTVPRAVAQVVDKGDEFRIGDRTVARIDSVRSIPIADASRRRLQLDLTLQTVQLDDQRQFLGERVGLGSTIPFETEEYQISGTVIGFNGSSRGSPAEATIRVRWSNVRPGLADALSVGLSEQHRGADATISGISTEPATVILQSDSGEIFAREHPVNKDVTLTLSVQARRTDGTIYFHGRPIQSGDGVVLDFGSVTVDGTVIDVAPSG